MKTNQPVVMVLQGSASSGPTECDGQFLESMDFEAFGGRGDLKLTNDLQRARKFSGLEEAWKFWRRSPLNKQYRPDGKPNRPLTAMNWEFRNEPALERKEGAK